MPQDVDVVVGLTQALVAEGSRLVSTFAAGHDLHHTDVIALAHVMNAEDRGAPLTAGGLGAALGLSSGAVTSVVDRLERVGHVSRVRDDGDRRRVHLHYSAQGRELGSAFFGPMEGAFAALVDDLGDDGRAAVVRYLAGAARLMAEHREALGR